MGIESYKWWEEVQSKLHQNFDNVRLSATHILWLSENFPSTKCEQADIGGSFLADEFHEWIELYDWQFNPVSFDGEIKYRWVNEAYSGQITTKELYEIFLSQS